MPTITLQGAFTSGELSPSLMARIDLAKYQQGCAKLENFLVQPHGGAAKRPGFMMLDTLPGEATLIPFVFNESQAYCLIFGEGWMRVAMGGGIVLGPNGAPYQIASPYTLEQARRLSFAQSADVLYLACHGVVPYKLKRYSHAWWVFDPVNFTCPITPPVWDWRVESYTREDYVKAYAPRDSFTADLPQAAEIISYTNSEGGTEYRYEPIDEALYTKHIVPVSNTVTSVQFVNAATKSDGSASPAKLVTPYEYVITSVNAQGKESVASTPAGITGPASNAWQSGDYIRCVWKPVPGAISYRVYKKQFGGHPGFIAETGGTEYNDYNASPTISDGPPTWRSPFDPGDYPAVVGFFEQRLVYASTPNRPQTIWMSKSGNYDDYSASVPLKADDALEMTIAGGQVAGICWLLPLRTLILGSTAIEWEISSSDGAFTAKTARVTPQSYRGSASLRALVIGNMLLHVTRSGREVRDLKYDFGADSYSGTDRSILASHMLEHNRIVNWCYQPAPDSVVWMVRDDGVLLGMTLQAEHEVCAWHRHTTQGLFKAVCSVPSGSDDQLFAVVQRANGFYLEQMAPRYAGGDVQAGVYLDCALQYSGGKVQTLSGLSHLEGRTVGILADGAVQPPRMVTGGAVTLDTAASRVTVGLAYNADLETMPVEIAGQDGVSMGRKRYINAVNVLFQNTVTGKAGLSFARLENVRWRNAEPHGAGLSPHTGPHRVVVPEVARNTASVCIRSDEPLPMTVLALMPELEVK